MTDRRLPERYRLTEPGEFPGFDRALALAAEDVQRTWPQRDAPPLELVVFQWADTASIHVAVAGGAGTATPLR
jgi:hypothetical protein